MPDEVDKVDIVVKKLIEFKIPVLVQSLEKREMELFIPQITIVNKNFNLASMLIRNGLSKIFDSNKANLSKASPLQPGKNGSIHLSKIEQNAFFSTSFVAVNSVSGISSSLGHYIFLFKAFPKLFSNMDDNNIFFFFPTGTNKRRKRDVKSFYINQPFLFFILQIDTQLALLSGKVENPSIVPM
mgnify:CR=1 FL=1